MGKRTKPLVLITGASGNIGSDLCQALADNYTVIGLDIKPCAQAAESVICDITSEDSIKAALEKIRSRHGRKIAAVVHLAAYFDFTGKNSSRYEEVNVRGTERLLDALQNFDVGRFIYSSTMLVHEAGVPGRKIDESTPIKPRWIYPSSKAEAEKIIQQKHGVLPYTILRLAGIYNGSTAVPTLSYQIARIYEREFKSHLYAGDLMAGQAFLHEEDMIEVFRRVIDLRNALPAKNIILAGESEVMGYQELQNRIGVLIFGQAEWKTFNIPEFIAKSGASLEMHMEPLVPDAIDKGEKPFIHPFMIDLASDHYHLDITRARKLLGWEPKHSIYDGLKKLVGSLKRDPFSWYEKNQIIPPDWVETAHEKKGNADRIRNSHEMGYRRLHQENLWAHFINISLAFWLITAPAILGHSGQSLGWSDIGSGLFLLIFSLLSLSWRFSFARWVCGGIGFWLLCAPLVFWAPTAAVYLNDTMVGMLVIGLSMLTRPVPGISPVAATTGPDIPPGWDYSPSDWSQRLPIIIMAFIGFFISRYLAAYQLGHIESVWEPFFSGSAADRKNGTEEIITSSVSEAWPVSDAGLGAVTYALEILTGAIGLSNRWRTMPWLVVLFGVMIVPLGAVSITFIIIQPIIIGTWCTLCLIAAAAMLIQIPYSVDELMATIEFLWRRKKQGRPLLRIFFTGDTDDGRNTAEDDFEQPPPVIVRKMLAGGVSLPWNLALCILIGICLMFTRPLLGTTGSMANADHLIGALVLTIAVTSLAELARGLRFLIMPLGAALLVLPFIYEARVVSLVFGAVCGLVLMALSCRRGQIGNKYGTCDRFII